MESEECKKLIESFKNKKGNYYPSWTKEKPIKKFAEIGELTHFYENYYSLMSEYHHLGTKSFGIRYKCAIRLDTAEIKLESLNAWCLAISSILMSLKVLSMRTNLLPKIELLYEKIANLPFAKTTYTSPSKAVIYIKNKKLWWWRKRVNCLYILSGICFVSAMC